MYFHCRLPDLGTECLLTLHYALYIQQCAKSHVSRRVCHVCHNRYPPGKTNKANMMDESKKEQDKSATERNRASTDTSYRGNL